MSATLPTRGRLVLDGPRRPSVPGVATSPFAVMLLAATAVGLAHLRWPGVLPLMVFVPLCLLAALVLPKVQVQLLFGYVVLWVAGLALAGHEDMALPALVLLGSMALMYGVASSRAHHGVHAFAGDRMLSDLRDRLFRMGDIPALPVGWRAERAFASAHGESFAGDFNVTVLDQEAGRLEMVLADVSGKGQHAGTRALVLGGVMSGLLGSAPSEQVLSMSNSFLDRERWDEGFATAVHVRIDLATGEAVIASAGHPAAAHYDAGSGRWTSVDGGRGPALGVIARASFPETRIRLDPGDALVVCTDGVIESRRCTLDDGVDWMLGTAEASLVHGLPGLADQLVRHGRAGVDDDRAAVVLWRE